MTELLEGLTNDLVVHKLKKYFVARGLPDGPYEFVGAETSDDGRAVGPVTGKLVFFLAKEKVVGEPSDENIRVILKFLSHHKSNPHLSLEITEKHPITRRNGEVIHSFSALLRPLEGEAS